MQVKITKVDFTLKAKAMNPTSIMVALQGYENLHSFVHDDDPVDIPTMCGDTLLDRDTAREDEQNIFPHQAMPSFSSNELRKAHEAME